MRGALRRRVVGFGGAALMIAACTYDFDEYVGEDGAASGGAASATGGSGGSTGGAGEAGAPVTPEGGTSGGAAARGGAAGAVDAGGEGGAPASAGGEGGGAPASAGGEGGADAGTAGTGTGGSANGGTGTGGSGSGGTATAGAGGSSGADCDALGGTTFDGHCYFYLSSLLNFASAQSACAEASATLVAINSAAEQRFLESTFFAPANDAWIGLSLAELTNPNSATCKATPSSCPFLWLTGEPLSYTKWGDHGANDREPNYTGACVRLQGATLDWADQGCTERVRAICETQ
jgi:hypothetical protein